MFGKNGTIGIGRPMFSISAVKIPTALMELSPETGLSDSHTLTRATTATVVDHEGIIRTAKAGELRVEKARRVENLFNNSENLTTWIILSGVSISDNDDGSYRLTIPIGSNSSEAIIQKNISPVLSIGNSAIQSWDIKLVSGENQFNFKNGRNTIHSSNFTITNEWGRYEGVSKIIGNTGQYFGISVATPPTIETIIDIRFPQLEDVTGQADQTASEYVSNGVLSYPYHGAGADGVKYFTTKKDGSPLDVEPYILVEKQGTNLLRSTALTTWSKNHISVLESNLIGVDEYTITETSGFGFHIFYKTATIQSGDLTYSMIAKALVTDRYIQLRPMGIGDGKAFAKFDLVNGVIAITGGSDYVSSSITPIGNGYYHCTLTANHPVAPTGVFIYITKSATIESERYDSITDNNVFIVGGVQLEQTAYPSSYIPTSGTAVTRNADVLKYDFGAGNFPQEFCYYADFEPLIDGGVSKNLGDYRLFGTDDTNGQGSEMRGLGNSSTWLIAKTSTGLAIYYTLPYNSISIHARTKIANSFQQSNQSIFKDGTQKLENTHTIIGTHSNTGTLEIANWNGAVMPMKIYSARMYPPLSEKILRKLTLPGA